MNLRKLAFKKDIQDISNLLLQKKNVCITGLPQVGLRNIVNLVAENINNKFDKIIFDDGFENIQEFVNKITDDNKNYLLCLPTLASRPTEFKKDFQQFVQGNLYKKYSMLISISSEDYLNLEEIFNISTKPVSYIYILKPRTEDQTKYLVTEYFPQADSLLISKIHDLTGGIPGLIQIISKDYLNNLEISEILKDPRVRILFQKYLSELNNMTTQDSEKLGFTNNGIITSSLLNEYLESIFNKNDDSYVSKVINLFEKNKGSLVTFDQIDKQIDNTKDHSIWKRYKIIERVKAKIPNSAKLVNVRGKGYRLHN